MKTVTLQIGNGDDKLSQPAWHDFVLAMKALIERHCETLHFSCTRELVPKAECRVYIRR